MACPTGSASPNRSPHEHRLGHVSHRDTACCAREGISLDIRILCSGIEAYKSKQKLVANKASDVAGKLNDLMDRTYTEENREKITEDIESFVKKYNSMMESADSSNSKNILETAGWLESMVNENRNLLNSIGISIGSDGKLEVDSNELKNANMDSLKEVFGYNPSGFAGKVLYKAEQIYSLAATYGTSATAYTSSGSYNRNYASANSDSSIDTTT